VRRAFRILRLFKLVRSVPSLRKIRVTLAQSMVTVGSLALLLLLMIVIFILLGMELFGGFYPRPELNYTSYSFPSSSATGDVPLNWGYVEDPNKMTITWSDDPSRYHFDDAGNAFVVIFVVLSGENWNEIMFNNHAASFDNNRDIPFAIIYFIALFFVGNLLLFNLFIAILLSNFDDDDEEEEPADAAESSAGQLAITKKPAEMMQWVFNGYSNVSEGVKAATSTTRKESTGDASNGDASADLAEETEKEAKIEKYPRGDVDGGGDRALALFSWSNPIRRMCAQLISHWLFESTIIALICISTVMMLFDMPHLQKDHLMRQFIAGCNLFFAVVFLIEMLMKWIVHGLFINKTPTTKFELADAYFKSPWNRLDFFIVVVSLIALTDQDWVKPLKAFRALRPLRLVSRYENLKITVATLFESIPAMASLITVAMLFFVVFGILGLELYSGRLGKCVDPLYDSEDYGSRVIPGLSPARLTDYEECMSLPRYNLTRRTTNGILISDMADMDPNADPNWLVFAEFPQWGYPQWGNFDNMGTSLLMLFEISALEGWPDVMHECQDTDTELFVSGWRLGNEKENGFDGLGGIDWAGAEPTPVEEHTPQTVVTAIFFILWIIVGCFVVMNMTIGVVVDTFSQIKAENDGLLLMSDDAADWVKAQKQVFAQRPLVQAPAPKEPWRLNVYYLVTSTRFEIAIMTCIILNMLQMGCDFWEPQYHEGCYEDGCVADGTINSPSIGDLKKVMFVIDIIFLVIYWIEMLLKFVGLGLMQYFKSPSNDFDCIIVLVSTLEVVLAGLASGAEDAGELPFPASLIRVLRLFRVVRILRVVKTAKQLRTIVATVYFSLPQLKNIMLLIGLIIVIVDVLCVSLFFGVNYTPGNFDPDYKHENSVGAGEVLPTGDNWYFSGDNNWGGAINRHANFMFFWTGALLLVRSSTGESFNALMHDLFSWDWGVNRLTCCPECGPIVDGDWTNYTIGSTGAWKYTRQPESSCGNTAVALLIYLVFQVVMAYIVLSIMIGVILENFANVGSETKKITTDAIEDFREIWLLYDPKGSYTVPSHNLLAILQQLKEPLGIKGKTPALTRAEMLKHLGKLDIPDHNGYIHFSETLTAIANEVAGVPVPVCDTTRKIQKLALAVPKLKGLEKPAHNALTNYLVSLLQSRWRGYAKRRQYEDEMGGGGVPGGGPSLAAPPKVKPTQVAPEPYSG